MKITQITCYLANFGGRSRGVIKVETDEGITGWGEAYSAGPDRSTEPIVDYIAAWLIGEDPRRIEYLMTKTYQQFRFPPGAVGWAAISGIEHALWDISGKAAGLPVYMLLGGHVRERIRVYQHLGGASPEEAAERAYEAYERWGVTAFKTSPYRIDPNANRWGLVCREAARYFEGLRNGTPESWEFAFDAHAKLFEPIKAVQLANALAPYDPYFYEEPLRPEHIPAWSALRPQMKVPLATGECLYGRFEFLDLVASQGADIIQPDICVCGGLLEMRKIAALAEAHYVTVAPHNPMGPIATAVNVQFAATAHNFQILEYLNPMQSKWSGWVEDPYLPEDGYLALRDAPGLGIHVCEEALAAESYQRWQRTAPVRPDGSTGYI